MLGPSLRDEVCEEIKEHPLDIIETIDDNAEFVKKVIIALNMSKQILKTTRNLTELLHFL